MSLIVFLIINTWWLFFSFGEADKFRTELEEFVSALTSSVAAARLVFSAAAAAAAADVVAAVVVGYEVEFDSACFPSKSTVF